MKGASLRDKPIKIDNPIMIKPATPVVRQVAGPNANWTPIFRATKAPDRQLRRGCGSIRV